MVISADNGVSVGVAKLGKTDVFFIPPGTRVNSDYYCRHILAEGLLPMMRQQSGGNFLLQQDGAPCHTAAATVQYLQQEGVDFIEKDSWPPSSPDLNPVDYFVWSRLQDSVYRRHHVTDIPTLRDAIVDEWDRLSQRSINHAIDQFLPRIQQVVEQNGGHIEQFHMND